MVFQLKSKLRQPLTITAITLAVATLALIWAYASGRPTTQTPTLADQFGQWMTQNSTTTIDISRVSCLDPTESRAALCQFTATTTPPAGAPANTTAGQPTTYHDFKCTAHLDSTNIIRSVDCPNNIAWIITAPAVKQ